MQELCVQGLVKVYGGRHGEKRALGGVSFTLGPGFYGLLGPNGAGKSTMINIIIGNLAATKGKVLWNGHNVRRLGRQFRAVLGYMPQQQNLYDSFTGQRFLQYMACAPAPYFAAAFAQLHCAGGHACGAGRRACGR